MSRLDARPLQFQPILLGGITTRFEMRRSEGYRVWVPGHVFPERSTAPMNKVLVLYDSASGNTAKMAALVAEGCGEVPEIEVRLRHLDEAVADDVLWCDGLALGSPTNMGILSWKMKRFWDETMMPHWMKVDGKIACAFSSSGGWGGGQELACQSLLTVLMNFGFQFSASPTMPAS